MFSEKVGSCLAFSGDPYIWKNALGFGEAVTQVGDR
jgi:hypothetical protein